MANLLGIHLNLLIGPTVAVPAPLPLVEALRSAEVTHTDQGRSGFQLTFQAGRSGPLDLLDYSLLSNPLLGPYNRVILTVAFNATPYVLMDGVITNQQLAPSNEPGASTLTVTGEDVSVMMDLQEKPVEHPSQGDAVIARKIILSYGQYGLLPTVIDPPTNLPPNPTQRTPVQRATDLRYLQTLAQRHGYVFYVTPGPATGTNTAYWGPPVRTGVPQKALSVNLGPFTNVESINFQNNAMAATTVTGHVQDRETNQSMPVQTVFSLRPPLSSQSALQLSHRRERLLEGGGGFNYTEALARAQAETDKSMDDVVTVSGELDALLYGELLRPRGLVDLRGVGYSYNGTYYVKSVTHNVSQGTYKQRFTLTRDGTGALSPMVRT